MRSTLVVGTALGALLLAGCMVGPDYSRPGMDMPESWSIATTMPTTQMSQPTQQAVSLVQWWTAFGDPTLDSLVWRAMRSNLDLKQAESRIRQARAQRGTVSAGLWPGVNSSGSYSRSGSGSGGEQDLFRAGLDAAWELDIFGGTRRNVEASSADLQAAIEDRRNVLVTLASEVAIDYLDLRGFQQQIRIANQNLDAQRKSADITQQRFQGGFVSRLDVANAQAQVASTLSVIPSLEAQVQQAIYELSILLGLPPTALSMELSPEGLIPATPPQVPVGLPSDLLLRRPDIRRAEAQFHAATARVGVATAQLYPTFSLTGSLNLSATDLSGMSNWANRSWSIGPSVSWPVFDAGRIRSQIQVQNEVQEQALLNWQQTVLGALRDVQSSLVAYVKEQQHRRALVDAVAANRQAVDLATQLYTQGQTDFLNVLSAQRSLYASEDALVQSNRNVATDLVALYKALGGGWEPAPATQPAAQAGRQ